MNELTLFEAFFVTHLVMDWIFQGKWEATKKSKELLPLIFHCSVYTLGFIPAFLFYKVNMVWLLLIFLSHAFFDQRKFEIWLVEQFKGIKKEGELEQRYNLISTMVDETLHLFILVLVVILS